MTTLESATVDANGLTFHCLEAGEGPLALCLHGFPDSANAYRFLLPELAKAGFRAVAIFMRGYAPTSVPRDGDYSSKALLSDVNALHQALGADDQAVLVAHDWGTSAAVGAMAAEPDRWRRAMIGSVPPLAVLGGLMQRYDQLKRSFYFWLFQMEIAQQMVAANDLEFIDRLWADWSPNFDSTEELKLIKPGLRDPKNLTAAMGYYRYMFNPKTYGSAHHTQELGSLLAIPIRQAVLYIHGKADGCIQLSDADVPEILKYFGEGSKVHRPEDVGHFFLQESPELINPVIVDFLTS